VATTSSDRRDAPLVDLALRQISKRFGALTVLDDLSLDVYKGELCCLLGPSGCGKTTTLKIVAGFLEPEAGAVRLAGQEITHRPPQKRNVGLVFQNYALFPHMNVLDNVAYGLRRRKRPPAEIQSRVAEMLRLVQLSGYEARRIHELSGGQQQRVALARALVIEPQLLLLDEPLSNLDARLRADMRDEIRRIQRALDITTVYVTHDQEEAMSIADRVVIMNRGRIEQIGPPRAIYEQPANRFVADFVGRVNFVPGRIAGGELVLLGKHYRLPRSEWPEGSALVCAIRPERVQIRAADSAFGGIVQETTYLGATVRYRIKVGVPQAGDVVLDVQVPSPQAIYRQGDRVGLEIRLEDVYLFRDRIV
jgi:putative spermidine/putrescine transport system ATP-binding protein